MKASGTLKASDVLRKAAELINNGSDSYACFAIADAAPLTHKGDAAYAAYEHAYEYFSSLFEPIPYRNNWFGYGFTPEQQEHRVMALLLTAELAESVGD